MQANYVAAAVAELLQQLERIGHWEWGHSISIRNGFRSGHPRYGNANGDWPTLTNSDSWLTRYRGAARLSGAELRITE